MNYMEYPVTCPLDEQQMSSLLYERDDLSAIDFSLLMKTIKAFSFGGDLQALASKPGSTISSIPSERRILININHDSLTMVIFSMTFYLTIRKMNN